MFFWTKRLERQLWSRDFATHKAWASDRTLSGPSADSSVELGMSLPSTSGHSDHEVPQSAVEQGSVNGPC